MGGGSESHGRWTAPQARFFRKIKDRINNGRGGQEKECVESDVQSIKIQQNWKHAAQHAQSWTEIVTEGGRRFMTEWRKEEEKKFKTRQEKGDAK